MLRGVWLTYRMHRFEVLLSLVLLGVLAISVWIVTAHIRAAAFSASCWLTDSDGNLLKPGCGALMDRYSAIATSEAGPARAGLALVVPVFGLILGVPVVARELELRTASLAWSLSLRRGRWLLSRLLPMLALVLVGAIVIGWLGAGLFQAMEVGHLTPSLSEVASYGPTLAARGLMALGIASLAGAVIGRTLPALLLAAMVVIAWSVVAVPMVQGVLSESRALWVNQGDEQNGVGYIARVDYGEFDPSRPGVNGEPGARFDPDERYRLQVAACGSAPADGTPELQVWSVCADKVPAPMDESWDKVVPQSDYPDYQLTEFGLEGVIGGAALLLTFPVVARRRPA